jgi:sec-independent protein translocase protein TatB
MLSIPHMIVVFIVVLVVFGPQKLPELARGLGKLMAEFRKASTDFKSAFEEEMREMERQTLQAERKKAAEAAAASAASAASAEPAQSPVPTLSDGPAAESPVISPVEESVARTPDPPSGTDSQTTAVADSHETPHDTRPSA